jgi:hypothetical protein
MTRICHAAWCYEPTHLYFETEAKTVLRQNCRQLGSCTCGLSRSCKFFAKTEARMHELSATRKEEVEDMLRKCPICPYHANCLSDPSEKISSEVLAHYKGHTKEVDEE